MKILFFSVLLSFASCGKPGTSKLYTLSDKSAMTFVNAKDLPADPNLTLDKSLINHSYPIQLALYKNHRFYYDLPKFGDGTGTWRLTKGVLELKAKTWLFPIYIEMHGANAEGSEVTVQFSDRFGPTTLKMSNVNI